MAENIFSYQNFEILLSKIINHMANYFRNENFKKLIIKITKIE